MSENGRINLTINGREVQSAPGRLLIDVAEEIDVFVPRFCYHPGLESVAACRMCLVEIEGSKRPLEPACVTYVTDGMVVRTDSVAAVDAQEGVLEMLLINHPLDCPICDRGGECPLQDQALRFGPGSSRYVDEKRHFPKPIPISELVLLDRERCVLCWRCVRFSEEVAGDPFIDLLDRGSHTQVNTAAGHPFHSYFSGNTIQICPVGALTAQPYRFLSRPWDLKISQSVCSFCSVGCPTTIEQRGGEVLRAQAMPNEALNSFWNCDKGRFGHHYISHPERLKAPLIRRVRSGAPRFEEAPWDDALNAIASKIREVLDGEGPQAIGLIGGSHATNEDLFAASRFFRQVLGTPNLDFRTFDASFEYPRLAAPQVLGSTASLDDLDRAIAILWVGPDPREELPVLYLRLRRAVEKGASLITIHPRNISLSGLGIDLRVPIGEEGQLIDALRDSQIESTVERGLVEAARTALASGSVVVCAGQQFVGRSASPTLDALRMLTSSLAPDARLLLCTPNTNSQGSIDMGVHPWGSLTGGTSGADAAEMLEAAAERRIKFLWIMGADLVSDFPDAQLVDRALASDVFCVVSELFPTDTARSADVILPAASVGEKEGSVTNLERRIQKIAPSVTSPGVARSDWWIFSDLAARLGHQWGWNTPADVAKAIAETLPTHSDFSWEKIEPPPLPRPRAGTRPGANAWPLSWELRAVDASRRTGWVWPLPDEAGGVFGRAPTPGIGRASEGEDPSGTNSGALRELGEEVSSPSTGREPGAGKSQGTSDSLNFPLALLVSRALFDNGAMVSRSTELAPVTPEPFVELHPAEAERRELFEGQIVSVASPRGSVRVRLRVSEDTPVGAAFMLFDQPGVRSNVLMDYRSEDRVEVRA